MTRWEYHWASVDPNSAEVSIATLDRLGADGWEAMAMVPVPRSDNQRVLFKREATRPDRTA
jgi:hypothetical protein